MRSPIFWYSRAFILCGVWIVVMSSFHHASGKECIYISSSKFSFNIKEALQVFEPLIDTLEYRDIIEQDFEATAQTQYLTKQGIHWAKISLSSETNRKLIFDFRRIDFVDVFYTEEGVDKSIKTGYLTPNAQKQLGKWNVVSIDIKKDLNYDLYFKLRNEAHLTDFNIRVWDDVMWYQQTVRNLIKDIGFLAIILIFTIYNLFVFLFSHQRGYLYLGLYLFTVFVFFVFASGILRDYVVTEYPYYTLLCIASILITPIFYYEFMAEFLNTATLIPKWNDVLKLVKQGDLLIFVMTLGVFFGLGNFQLMSKITQYTLMINIAIGFVAIFLLFINRNELVMYFILGTLVMICGSTYDVIFWDSRGTWGDVSRIGFVSEIIFFSLGLGKKIQRGEQDRLDVQASYIDQLLSLIHI